MRNNQLLSNGETIIRLLDIKDDQAFILIAKEKPCQNGLILILWQIAKLTPVRTGGNMGEPFLLMQVPHDLHKFSPFILIIFSSW